MDPEALVTFLYRAPPDVRIVELMGSWDNFNRPYRMHHDPKRGDAFFTGCFKFEDIIFDGDDFQWTKPRTGGLKQGGTYWYYYRLNYDIDGCDDRQRSTTSCPLLPGQAVNVIEVPYEMIDPPSRCHSACAVIADIAGSLANAGEEKTLDPAQKMAALEPPPFSKIHRRCVSDEALEGRLENQNGPVIVVDEAGSPASAAQYTAPQESRDSKVSQYLPVKDDVFRPTSPSSTEDAGLVSDTATSGSIDRRASRYLNDEHFYGLPSYPYPCALGPTPLGSDEALGAAMFTHEDVIAGAADALAHQHLDGDGGKQTKRISVLSLGPVSVQNVQFYGSRPGTCLTQDPEQHRPRMYSLPNMELRDYLDESSPTSPTSSYSHRVDESPSPASDGAVFDLVSPTFSASTVDTDDGHTTPSRMSAQIHRRGSDYASSEDLDALRHWLRGSSRNRAQSETVNVTAKDRSFLSPILLNYSLPSLASESNPSLTKTTTMSTQLQHAPRSREDVHLPIPAILSEGEGRSMAEDIFSELGF